ncbi:MAG: ribosome maturation factor RimM [Peptococcaceae bacterium]|jgi:16S rRNA processing protein RimM|nr:ribosome maturation factor RimM [Peptococcaceae bacterium]
MDTDTVLIGKVTRAFGVQGALRVYPITHDPQRYKDLKEVILQFENNTPRRFSVREAQVYADCVCLALDGIGDREQAEACRGYEVRVDRKDVPPLSEGWYYFELEGLKVYEGEVYWGTLKQVVQTGANDIYLVAGPQGEICVPALKSVVQEVDLERGIMQVTLPPGLVEDEGKP